MIKLLTIQCKGVVCISATTNGQNEPAVKVSLEDVEHSALIISLMESKEVGIKEILEHITVEDIEAFLRGEL